MGESIKSAASTLQTAQNYSHEGTAMVYILERDFILAVITCLNIINVDTRL